MSSLAKEFKDFINRGNVVDLAVAVVIGAAFGAIIDSFVDDILMQIIAAIGGQPDFRTLTIDIGDGHIRYGLFLNALVSFLIISMAVFLVVKALNRLQRARRSEEVPEPDEPLTQDQQLLTEIRDLLAKDND